MNTQHTPGPWFAALDGWAACTVQHNLPTGHIGQIAFVQATGAKTQQEGISNAKLIAAAPELLNALKALVIDAEAWFDVYENETGDNAKGAIIEARKAIAKAEGKR